MLTNLKIFLSTLVCRPAGYRQVSGGCCRSSGQRGAGDEGQQVPQGSGRENPRELDRSRRDRCRGVPPAVAAVRPVVERHRAGGGVAGVGLAACLLRADPPDRGQGIAIDMNIDTNVNINMNINMNIDSVG